jgi:hypothetical protein
MNVSYRGFKSVTFFLVMLGYLTGTWLVWIGTITGTEWVNSVLGLLAGYVIRDGVSKAAEAYRDKPNTPP